MRRRRRVAGKPSRSRVAFTFGMPILSMTTLVAVLSLSTIISVA